MRKKIISLCCSGILFSLIVASLSMAAPNHQISSQLFKFLDSEDPSIKYSTLMLLSHTTITDQVYDGLNQFVTKEKDQVIKLTAYYVLAKRLQEKKFIQLFIDNYPTGGNQRKISDFHWKNSQYLNDATLSSPLQTYLAKLSSKHDSALDKLVSGYHSADSTNELSAYIAELYRNDPNRIRPILKKNKVSETEIKKLLHK